MIALAPLLRDCRRRGVTLILDDDHSVDVDAAPGALAPSLLGGCGLGRLS